MDSPKLNPCPHCGKTDLRVYWNDIYEKHYVRCHTCHMQGPEIYGREAAAEAWNALPRGHAITPGAAGDGGMTSHDVEQAMRQVVVAVEKAVQQIVALVGKLEQSIKPGELEPLDIERVSGPFLTKEQIETIVRKAVDEQEARL